MNSEVTQLFKNKRERTARFSKGPVVPKSNLSPDFVLSTCKGEKNHAANPFEPVSTGPAVIASGVVSNDQKIFSSGTSCQEMLKQEGNLELEPDSGHIKLKLNVAETKFYKLKPRSKPDELNEELLFTRNLRRSVKFNDELKRLSRGAKRAKKDNIKDVKAPCFGSISKSNKVQWSFDTPAPEELIKIHRRNFNLDDECWQNEGPKLYYRPDGTVMDWDHFLTSDPTNLMSVPPVTNFKWAPFRDIWHEVAKEGLSIELRNPFIPGATESYWVGTIIHYAGYRALVKFETFDSNPSNSHMTWISFCSDVPKPLGWCRENKKDLIPGPIVPHFEEHLFHERLQEFSKRPTISPDHCLKLSEEIRRLQNHWNVSVPVEAMDVHSLHQNRLARITAVVGDRVNINYYSTDEDQDDYSDGYWFHYKSQGLHPLYWSQTVGVVLNGVPSNGTPDFELPAETFKSWPADKIVIEVGMRLEALHPYHTNTIVGAVVVKVLNHGYFEIQTREADTFGRLHFVYHVTSPYVLPWGFGSKHGIRIDFEDDDGDSGNEEYPDDYLNLNALPPRREHYFTVGDKLEAFEFTNTSFIGPATVKKIAGHLLLIHFDNWKEIDCNYQWVDAQSTEIYPLGYAQMLGLKWQGGQQSDCRPKY